MTSAREDAMKGTADLTAQDGGRRDFARWLSPLTHELMAPAGRGVVKAIVARPPRSAQELRLLAPRL